MSESSSVKQVALINVAKVPPKKRCKTSTNNEVEAGIKSPEEDKYKQVSTKRAMKIKKARENKSKKYKKAEARVVLSRSEKCRIMCGIDSFVTLLFILASTVGNGILYYYYSVELMNVQRKYIWVFLVLFFISLLLSLTLSYLTLNAIFQEQQKSEEKRSTIVVTRARALSKSLSAIAEKKVPITKQILLKIWNFYRSVSDVNGKYYLLKMQISEVLENLNLLYNYLTIYVCSLPFGIHVVIFIAFGFEAMNNMLNLFKIYSPSIRNRQLLLDVMVDLLCLFVPILYGWFYFIPLEVEVTMQLVVLPNLFFLTRANDIYLDLYSIDLQRIDPEMVAKKSRYGRRQSIFKSEKLEKIMNDQNEQLIPLVKIIYGTLNSGVVLLIFIIINIQFWHQMNPKTTAKCNDLYSSDVWSGCLVKVPVYVQNLLYYHPCNLISTNRN